MMALFVLGIVFAALGLWAFLGWRLAGPCARRMFDRTQADHKARYSLLNFEREDQATALGFGTFVAILWPAGVIYLLCCAPPGTRSKRLRRWLPDLYLKDLIKQNEKRAKELGL